eukprot:tig00020563_g11275.t1
MSATTAILVVAFAPRTDSGALSVSGSGAALSASCASLQGAAPVWSATVSLSSVPPSVSLTLPVTGLAPNVSYVCSVSIAAPGDSLGSVVAVSPRFWTETLMETSTPLPASAAAAAVAENAPALGKAASAAAGAAVGVTVAVSAVGSGASVATSLASTTASVATSAATTAAFSLLNVVQWLALTGDLDSELLPPAYKSFADSMSWAVLGGGGPVSAANGAVSGSGSASRRRQLRSDVAARSDAPAAVACATARWLNTLALSLCLLAAVAIARPIARLALVAIRWRRARRRHAAGGPAPDPRRIERIPALDPGRAETMCLIATYPGVCLSSAGVLRTGSAPHVAGAAVFLALVGKLKRAIFLQPQRPTVPGGAGARPVSLRSAAQLVLAAGRLSNYKAQGAGAPPEPAARAGTPPVGTSSPALPGSPLNVVSLSPVRTADGSPLWSEPASPRHPPGLAIAIAAGRARAYAAPAAEEAEAEEEKEEGPADFEFAPLTSRSRRGEASEGERSRARERGEARRRAPPSGLGLGTGTPPGSPKRPSNPGSPRRVQAASISMSPAGVGSSFGGLLPPAASAAPAAASERRVVLTEGGGWETETAAADAEQQQQQQQLAAAASPTRLLGGLRLPPISPAKSSLTERRRAEEVAGPLQRLLAGLQARGAALEDLRATLGAAAGDEAEAAGAASTPPAARPPRIELRVEAPAEEAAHSDAEAAAASPLPTARRLLRRPMSRSASASPRLLGTGGAAWAAAAASYGEGADGDLQGSHPAAGSRAPSVRFADASDASDVKTDRKSSTSGTSPGASPLRRRRPLPRSASAGHLLGGRRSGAGAGAWDEPAASGPSASEAEDSEEMAAAATAAPAPAPAYPPEPFFFSVEAGGPSGSPPRRARRRAAAAAAAAAAKSEPASPRGRRPASQEADCEHPFGALASPPDSPSGLAPPSPHGEGGEGLTPRRSPRRLPPIQRPEPGRKLKLKPKPEGEGEAGAGPASPLGRLLASLTARGESLGRLEAMASLYPGAGRKEPQAEAAAAAAAAAGRLRGGLTTREGAMGRLEATLESLVSALPATARADRPLVLEDGAVERLEGALGELGGRLAAGEPLPGCQAGRIRATLGRLQRRADVARLAGVLDERAGSLARLQAALEALVGRLERGEGSRPAPAGNRRTSVSAPGSPRGGAGRGRIDIDLAAAADASGAIRAALQLRVDAYATGTPSSDSEAAPADCGAAAAAPSDDEDDREGAETPLPTARGRPRRTLPRSASAGYLKIRIGDGSEPPASGSELELEDGPEGSGPVPPFGSAAPAAEGSGGKGDRLLRPLPRSASASPKLGALLVHVPPEDADGPGRPARRPAPRPPSLAPGPLPRSPSVRFLLDPTDAKEKAPSASAPSTARLRPMPRSASASPRSANAAMEKAAVAAAASAPSSPRGAAAPGALAPEASRRPLAPRGASASSGGGGPAPAPAPAPAPVPLPSSGPSTSRSLGFARSLAESRPGSLELATREDEAGPGLGPGLSSALDAPPPPPQQQQLQLPLARPRSARDLLRAAAGRAAVLARALSFRAGEYLCPALRIRSPSASAKLTARRAEGEWQLDRDAAAGGVHAEESSGSEGEGGYGGERAPDDVSIHFGASRGTSRAPSEAGDRAGEGAEDLEGYEGGAGAGAPRPRSRISSSASLARSFVASRPSLARSPSAAFFLGVPAAPGAPGTGTGAGAAGNPEAPARTPLGRLARRIRRLDFLPNLHFLFLGYRYKRYAYLCGALRQLKYLALCLALLAPGPASLLALGLLELAFLLYVSWSRPHVVPAGNAVEVFASAAQLAFYSLAFAFQRRSLSEADAAGAMVIVAAAAVAVSIAAALAPLLPALRRRFASCKRPPRPRIQSGGGGGPLDRERPPSRRCASNSVAPTPRAPVPAPTPGRPLNEGPAPPAEAA